MHEITSDAAADGSDTKEVKKGNMCKKKRINTSSAAAMIHFERKKNIERREGTCQMNAF